MNVNDFNLKKTALMFFDILNGYYHGADAAATAKVKPWVDNAVRLMKAGRQAGMPIFFARGNHRPDNSTSALLLTDTNNSLKPWPDGEVTKGKMHVFAGDESSDVIPELDPRPDDYYIPKYRWSGLSPDLFGLGAAFARPRHNHPIRRFYRRRRNFNGLLRQRFGLQHHRRARRLRDIS